MKTDKLLALYFSPTNTTKKIIHAIAAGINAKSSQISSLNQILENKIIDASIDLLLIGVPVYGGRIPKVAREMLEKLEYQNLPVVLVAIYGNNTAGDTLLELKDFAIEKGMTPLAAASFVGEHSFSNIQYPIAPNRPDKNDLLAANFFGKRIKNIMNESSSIKDFTIDQLKVPGNTPYKPLRKLEAQPPVSNSERCNNCGACIEACPVLAIDKNLIADTSKCIQCFACVKVCKQSARESQDENILSIAKRLHDNCPEPKQPQFYL